MPTKDLQQNRIWSKVYLRTNIAPSGFYRGIKTRMLRSTATGGVLGQDDGNFRDCKSTGLGVAGEGAAAGSVARCGSLGRTGDQTRDAAAAGAAGEAGGGVTGDG